MDINKQENFEAVPSEGNVEIKDEELQEGAAAASDIPQIPQIQQPAEIVPVQKIKKVKYILINHRNRRFNTEYYFFRTLCLNKKRLLLLDERYIHFVSLCND